MNDTGIPPTAETSGSSRFALGTLAAGSFLCVLAAVTSPLFDLDRHAAPKEALLHAAALLACTALAAGAREFRVSRLDAALAAWLGVAALSSLGAENPWLAFRAFSLSLSGVCVFWAARTLARRGGSITLQRAVACATVAAAATALAQAYGLDLPAFASTRVPGGTFGNRNFMAHAIALGLPTLVLAGFRTPAERRWACAGTAVVAAALVLSRTRAAWLAVGLAAGVALPLVWSVKELCGSPHLRRTGLSLLAAGLMGVAAALVLPNTLDWHSSNPYLDTALTVVNYKAGSGKGRLIQYRNTLGMVADHPLLGVGPGNWPVAYSLYATRHDPSLGAVGRMPTNPWPSSDWVGFLVEWGPAGLGLLVIPLASLALGAVRKVASAAGLEHRLEAVALASTVTVLGAVGAVDSVLHLAAPNFLFWTAAGALAPAVPPWKTLRPGAGTRRVALCAFAALAGASTVRSAAQTASILVARDGGSAAGLERAALLDPGNYRLHLLLAQEWTRRGRCDRARPHAAAASRLFPHLADPKRLLSACRAAATP